MNNRILFFGARRRVSSKGDFMAALRPDFSTSSKAAITFLRTLTSYTPVARRSVVAVAVLLLCSTCLINTSARSQPAVADLLSPLLKHVNGFNAWVSYPSYTGSDTVTNASKSINKRYAFSLKYNVLDLFVHDAKPDTLVVENVERDSANGTLTKSVTTLKPKERKGEPGGNISVNFGYSWTSPIAINSHQGFSTSFPISGFFTAGILTASLGNSFSFSAGIQANFNTLSNVNATIGAGDTNGSVPVQFSSGLSISPELFGGLAYDLGSQLGHVIIFVDGVFQFAEFGGLSYSPINANDQTHFRNLYSRLPQSFILNSTQLKVGFSISTGALNS